MLKYNNCLNYVLFWEYRMQKLFLNYCLLFILGIVFSCSDSIDNSHKNKESNKNKTVITNKRNKFEEFQKPNKQNIFTMCRIDSTEFSLHFFEYFNQDNRNKCIAIFTDRNYKVYGRLSAPLTKVFIASQYFHEWTFEYINSNFGNIENLGNNAAIGRFGKLYDCEFKKIGTDGFGLILNSAYSSRIMPYSNENFTNGCNIITKRVAWIDHGIADPNKIYSASYSFIPDSAKSFFDIKVVANGNIDIEGNDAKISNKTYLLTFVEGKYLRSKHEDLIGDYFYIGSLRYQISKIEFSSLVSNSFTSSIPDGIYLMIYLSVTNFAHESSTLTSSLFTVIDSDGYEFKASQNAITTLILSYPENVFLLKEIPPKITKQLIIPFEVPTKLDNYKLRISNGLWADEIKFVKLKK